VYSHRGRRIDEGSIDGLKIVHAFGNVFGCAEPDELLGRTRRAGPDERERDDSRRYDAPVHPRIASADVRGTLERAQVEPRRHRLNSQYLFPFHELVNQIDPDR